MDNSIPTPLRLRPELEELDRLIGYIDSFAEERELSAKDAYALNLVAEELFANTIDHSHPPATLVEFTLILEPDTVAAIYVDDGGAYDPTQRPEVDITLSAEERPIGGLGVHFIRVSMEDFDYIRQGDRNVTRFRRRLSV